MGYAINQIRVVNNDSHKAYHGQPTIVLPQTTYWPFKIFPFWHLIIQMGFLKCFHDQHSNYYSEFSFLYFFFLIILEGIRNQKLNLYISYKLKRLNRLKSYLFFKTLEKELAHNEPIAFSLVSSLVFRIQHIEHLNAKYLSILLHLPSKDLQLEVNVTSY